VYWCTGVLVMKFVVHIADGRPPVKRFSRENPIARVARDPPFLLGLSQKQFQSKLLRSDKPLGDADSIQTVGIRAR
jgi:hypothetical protein